MTKEQALRVINFLIFEIFFFFENCLIKGKAKLCYNSIDENAIESLFIKFDQNQDGCKIIFF